MTKETEDEYVSKLLDIIESAPRELWKDILITFSRCVEAKLTQA